MDFRTSTHRRHWLFTQESLRDVQEETTFLAAEACEKGDPPEGSRCFAMNRSVTADTAGASGASMGGANGGKMGKKRPAAGVEPLLTVEEEGLIKSYYAKKIQETCGRHSAHEDLRRSDKVQATAVGYFARFYLSNSVLEHDPKLVILTCIFLASKTEEQITNVNLLAKATGVDDLQILSKELPLLQGLSFHLAVFHPYRALPALLEGARLKSKESGIEPRDDRLVVLHDGARAALDDVVVSDLSFLHPPSHLALAVLLREGRRMEDPPFDIATMLSLEFHDHKEWAEVLVAANILALEMDSLLPYQVEKDKLRAVNKKLKKHALWSETRGSTRDVERRRSKKVKIEST